MPPDKELHLAILNLDVEPDSARESIAKRHHRGRDNLLHVFPIMNAASVQKFVKKLGETIIQA